MVKLGVMAKKVESGKKSYEIQAQKIEETRAILPDDSTVTRQVELFKALSDPARIKIVKALADRDICVCELMQIMEMSQAIVSHHLKVLKYADIISDTRCGRLMVYSLVDRRVLKVLEITSTSD